MADGKTIITLKASSGDEFKVSSEELMSSHVLKLMINRGNLDITLPNVNDRTLKKVLEYCKKHAECDKKGQDNLWLAYGLERWEEEYIKVDRDQLFHLIRAANNLEIDGLINLCSKELSNKILKKEMTKKKNQVPSYDELYNQFRHEAFEIQGDIDFYTEVKKRAILQGFSQEDIDYLDLHLGNLKDLSKKAHKLGSTRAYYHFNPTKSEELNVHCQHDKEALYLLQLYLNSYSKISNVPMLMVVTGYGSSQQYLPPEQRGKIRQLFERILMQETCSLAAGPGAFEVHFIDADAYANFGYYYNKQYHPSRF